MHLAPDAKTCLSVALIVLMAPWLLAAETLSGSKHTIPQIIFGGEWTTTLTLYNKPPDQRSDPRPFFRTGWHASGGTVQWEQAG